VRSSRGQVPEWGLVASRFPLKKKPPLNPQLLAPQGRDHLRDYTRAHRRYTEGALTWTENIMGRWGMGQGSTDLDIEHHGAVGHRPGEVHPQLPPLGLRDPVLERALVERVAGELRQARVHAVLDLHSTQGRPGEEVSAASQTSLETPGEDKLAASQRHTKERTMHVSTTADGCM